MGQTPFPPAREGGIVSGPDGALWFTNQDRDSIGRMRIRTRL